MADLLQAFPLAAALGLVAYFTTTPAPAPITTVAAPARQRIKRDRPLRLIDRYSRLQLLEMANQLEVGTAAWRRKASKQRLYAALMRVGVSHG